MPRILLPFRSGYLFHILMTEPPLRCLMFHTPETLRRFRSAVTIVLLRTAAKCRATWLRLLDRTLVAAFLVTRPLMPLNLIWKMKLRIIPHPQAYHRLEEGLLSESGG